MAHGAWLCLGCGNEADRQQCYFLLSFGYVYVNVGFRVHQKVAPGDEHGRPIKFVVGFHYWLETAICGH